MIWHPQFTISPKTVIDASDQLLHQVKSELIMSETKEFQGGLFDAENKRKTATLHLQVGQIRALARDGQEYKLPLSDAGFEIGGASNHMSFVRNQDRSLTLFCDDPLFSDALLPFASAKLHAEISSYHSSRQTKKTVLWSSLSALAAVLVLGVSALAGSWHERMANLVDEIPISVDETIGKAAIDGMDLGGKEVEDEAITGPLQEMLEKLAPHASRGGFKFNVRVIRNENVNAFALPGGQIVFFTGLLEQAETPEEVAGVMAHEMGHVTLRHGITRIARSLGIVAAMQVVLGDVGGLVGMGRDLLTLTAVNSYSRTQENEADAAAVHTLYAAGLPADAMVAFFKADLNKEETKEETKEEAKEDDSDDDLDVDEAAEELSRALSWLSTHPDHKERIQAIEALVKTLPEKKSTELKIEWKELKAALASSTK